MSKFMGRRKGRVLRPVLQESRLAMPRLNGAWPRVSNNCKAIADVNATTGMFSRSRFVPSLSIVSGGAFSKQPAQRILSPFIVDVTY
jgi:hypothetical protein